VFVEQGILNDLAPDIASTDVVAFLHGRLEWPFLFPVECWKCDASGNVNAVCFVGNVLKRTLDTIVDLFHQTRTELDG